MRLATEEIVEFFEEKIKSYGLYPSIDNNQIIFETRFCGGIQHRATILFKLDWPTISLSISLYPPDDFILDNFLSKLKDDSIFMAGGELYILERYEKLKEWKKWLERIPSNNGLECKILREPSNIPERKEIKSAIFEYLGRPALYFITCLKKKDN